MSKRPTRARTGQTRATNPVTRNRRARETQRQHEATRNGFSGTKEAPRMRTRDWEATWRDHLDDGYGSYAA